VVDVPTAILGLVSAVLLLRYRINATWLVLAGALVGLFVFPAFGRP
jgi:chromate transporter